MAATSSRSLPAGQPVAVLDQTQGFQIVFRRGFERGAVAQRFYEMRDRPVVGALIFGGEIVTLLRGRGARACQQRPIEPYRSAVAENFEAVDLRGQESMRGEACEDGDRSAALGFHLDHRAVLARHFGMLRLKPAAVTRNGPSNMRSVSR